MSPDLWGLFLLAVALGVREGGMGGGDAVAGVGELAAEEVEVDGHASLTGLFPENAVVAQKVGAVGRLLFPQRSRRPADA